MIHSCRCGKGVNNLGSVARGEGCLTLFNYLRARGGRRRLPRTFPHPPDKFAPCFSCFTCFRRFTCFSCFICFSVSPCFRNAHSPQKMKHSQCGMRMQKPGLEVFYHPVRRTRVRVGQTGRPLLPPPRPVATPPQAGGELAVLTKSPEAARGLRRRNLLMLG